MSTQEITREALALPIPDRVALAEALWQSIAGASTPSDEVLDAVDAARRRNDELESGSATIRTHEQVMHTARGAVPCK